MQGQWLAPRVINLCLSYVTHAISPARTWKVVQPHVPALLQACVFPLACFDDDDATLWHDDPQEYIRKVGTVLVTPEYSFVRNDVQRLYSCAVPSGRLIFSDHMRSDLIRGLF